jgi:hypothetical protein
VRLCHTANSKQIFLENPKQTISAMVELLSGFAKRRQLYTSFTRTKGGTVTAQFLTTRTRMPGQFLPPEKAHMN